jgi:hypothetical protein
MKAQFGITETVLIIGVLVASGITIYQLMSFYKVQTTLSKEEVVIVFAKDLEAIIDKATATTGDVAFVYSPPLVRYYVKIENNTVFIHDKSLNKNASFSKATLEIVSNYFEDSKKITIVKKENKIFVMGRCLEEGESCHFSLACCSGFCWGKKDNYNCKSDCAPNGEYAPDPSACCSKYLNSSLQCDNPPVCEQKSICPGSNDQGIWVDSRGNKCCPFDRPVCSFNHCCPEDRPKWCDNPKSGGARCMNSTEYESECASVPDSPCTSIWPAHQGFKVWINEENFACDLFEVAHPGLDWIVEEAEECCEKGCVGNCHSLCNNASSQSGGNVKKCKGLYIIYGLGPAGKFMKDYFWPEICCYGDQYCLYGCDVSDLGKCSCKGHSYSTNAKNLPCVDWPSKYPLGWASDTDMSKNSCKFSDLIAHANILEDKGIHTGSCVDYSVSLTTLLRKAGYTKDEVFTTCGPGHAYNLVKFPGDLKYHIVDTTGNKPNPITLGGKPSGNYSYCSYGSGCQPACMNDAYNGNCPAKSEVYGC